MFWFIQQRMGTAAAYGLTACWYACLILFVLYSAFEPQAEFSYLRF